MFESPNTQPRMCRNITDASVLEVARRCSNLQSLNLRSWRITDASLMEVARRCSNLQTLDLSYCKNITDASLLEVARRCSNLQSLDLSYCGSRVNRRCRPPAHNITDASLMEVARRCSNLQSLNLHNCMNITDACKSALRLSHPKLELTAGEFGSF